MRGKFEDVRKSAKKERHLKGQFLKGGRIAIIMHYPHCNGNIANIGNIGNVKKENVFIRLDNTL